jgi:hypothetical protein
MIIQQELCFMQGEEDVLSDVGNVTAGDKG